MAEDELTRGLVRRAYAAEPFDADAGLAEVVRRAGRPPVDGPDDSSVEARSRHAVNVRRRRQVSVLAVFAGVVGLVLVIGVATGRLAGGPGPGLEVGARPSGAPSLAKPWPSGSPAPGFSRSYTPGPSAPPSPSDSIDPGGHGVPIALPSQCAYGLTLSFSDGQFHVGDSGSGCPTLQRKRVFLRDTRSGNGLYGPGDATLWPVPGSSANLELPYSYTVPAIPSLEPGHFYELVYIPGNNLPSAGADAYKYLDNSLIIALRQ
ncbi:hypothetical protein [Dactylosporangium sp. CA-233914]|uniref:hypothetical protein n=1 Tax=Dactylosporangium sp. CA-233914 TaxID=3239934 RepID=UPI003D8C4E82